MSQTEEFRRLMQRLESQREHHLRSTHSLTGAQYDMLLCLHNCDGQTMGDLAAALSCSGGNLTGITDRLERDGLVQRRRSIEDRREVLVELTPWMAQRVADIVAEVQAWQAQFDAALQEARLEPLAERLGVTVGAA